MALLRLSRLALVVLAAHRRQTTTQTVARDHPGLVFLVLAHCCLQPLALVVEVEPLAPIQQARLGLALRLYPLPGLLAACQRAVVLRWAPHQQRHKHALAAALVVVMTLAQRMTAQPVVRLALHRAQASWPVALRGQRALLALLVLPVIPLPCIAGARAAAVVAMALAVTAGPVALVFAAAVVVVVVRVPIAAILALVALAGMVS